jgi:hypothetical protein
MKKKRLNFVFLSQLIIGFAQGNLDVKSVEKFQKEINVNMLMPKRVRLTAAGSGYI